MEVYIALKPVRFDKDYAIGEVIPDQFIDQKMARRLIGWGKIQRVPAPDLPAAPRPARRPRGEVHV